ncbi:DUF2306 domain-containing protein [Actinomadura rupiterrae]|uniref:DUF2306 domain-containing protein n=1 Tax=Actinomadura rupiterrae TaxID=559627 RepID=UPI0020A2FD3D|nr:DUF2306 domain-containing protein [Actinomadura rupiterrae]MCP2342721.1 uncharacterized membrane protein YozB (DUF420 family) [Actinomadura rupiterrae]
MTAAPRKACLTWLMFAVAAVFGAVLVGPYLLLDISSSRVDVSSKAHYALLVGHIFTACVALVLGPLQFVPAIRARRAVHRRIGRLYLFAGVLPSSVAAVPVALLSEHLLTRIGLSIPAVLWLVTGVLAYRAARRHDYVQHRNWMMRNYALTFLAVTSRVLVPLMLLSTLPFTTSGPIAGKAQSLTALGQATGWIINLVLAETLIRRGRTGGNATRPAPGAQRTQERAG